MINIQKNDEKKHFILRLMEVSYPSFKPKIFFSIIGSVVIQFIAFKVMNRLTTNNINKLFGQVLACFLMILITFCIVSSVESYTLSVSHLPQLQKGRAFLLMTDLSGIGPSIDVRFYDESGKEAAAIHKLLPPKGKIQIYVGNYLKSSGSIVVESSNEMILAEYWQIYNDGTVSMLPFQSPVGEERYLLNCFKFPSCEESYIAICDPQGNGPMVQMEFYSKTGELMKITRKMLRPHSIMTFKIGDYASKDIVGKVSVRSFGGGITLHTIHSCGKKAVFALPVSIPSKYLIVDGFSANIETDSGLIIVDASAKGTRFKISIFDDRGEMVNSLDRSLLANSAMLINLGEFTDNVENGIVKIDSESEIIADYWEGDLKTGKIEITLENPKLKARYSENILAASYFSSHDNAEFILSFLNIGRESIVAELEIYNSDGERIGSKKIPLEPYKHFKESINRYFNKLRLGTIIVRDPNSSLLVTSSIVNNKNGQLFGKIYAISR